MKDQVIQFKRLSITVIAWMLYFSPLWDEAGALCRFISSANSASIAAGLSSAEEAAG